MLLQLILERYPGTQAAALAQAAAEAAAQLMGEHPTIDLGLVILARALELPPGSPLALFALGRTIGWIGHAIEQYQLDRIIRPRARYTGVLPPG
jgi:citrate synthase